MIFRSKTFRTFRLTLGVKGLLTAVVIVLTSPSASADSIRLHDQAGSTDAMIELREIAELEGPYAESFADLVIDKFSADAKRHAVTLRMLREALSDADANWAELSLKGFTSCEVFRTDGNESVPATVTHADRAIGLNQAVELGGTTATLQAMIEQKIAELAGVDPDELKIVFRDGAAERDWLQRSVHVARYELQPLSRSGLGRVSIKVIRFDETGVNEQTTLTAEVSRKLTAVVATQAIRRGEAFTSQNIAIREVEITADRGPLLDDLSLALGQKADASLRAGSLLLPSHVAAEVLIERGDLVTVSCLTGSLVVRTVARATGSGGRGDLITLRNEQTREMFTATVAGRRQATITAPQTAPGAH